MTTFVVLASQKHAEQLEMRAERVIKKLLMLDLALDPPPKWGIVRLAPWAVVALDMSTHPLTATTLEVRGHRAVVSVGHLSGLPPAQTASALSSRWETGGYISARRGGGSYAAALLDTEVGQIDLVNDRVGVRALRYAFIDGYFIASPHDVALMATGLIEARPDPVSFTSLGTYGWSVGAASLIEGIEAVPPQSTVRWQDASIEIIADSFDPVVKGVSREDAVAHAADVIEHYIVAECDAATSVTADITAGIDSRAICATLSKVSDLPLSLQSSGSLDSVDVVVAERLAGDIGVPYVWNSGDSDESHWSKSLELLAFSINGDGSAQNAFAPGDLDPGRRHFTGVCGEEVRGYPFRGMNPDLVADWSSSALASRWEELLLERRGQQILGLLSPEYKALVAGRLQKSFAQTREFHEHGFMALLASIRNEWGRVRLGNIQRYPRFELQRHPFKEASVYEALAGFDPMLLRKVTIHHELIRRHQPGWLGMLINGRHLLAPPFESGFAKRRRQCRQVVQRRWETKRGYLPAVTKGIPLEVPMDQMLSRGLEDTVVSQFGEQVASSYLAGELPRKFVLSLATADEFWRQIEQVS